MTDLFNALFELGASIFLTLDIQALRRDRRVAGISVISRVFFVAWGLFNPYFYAVQGLTYSFIAGLIVCGVNLWWLGQYWIIKREEQRKQAKEHAEAIAWDEWRDSLVRPGEGPKINGKGEINL